MFSTIECYHLIFPKKFSSYYYLFVYSYGDNNVVGLMQPTPQRAYTPEVEILYEYVVDNMVDDMLVEAMED